MEDECIDHFAGKIRFLLGKRAPLAAIVFVCILSATPCVMKTTKEGEQKKNNRSLQQTTSSSRHLISTTSTDWFKDFLTGFDDGPTKNIGQTRSEALGGTSFTLWGNLPFGLNLQAAEGDSSEESDYPFYVHSMPPTFCGGTLVHRDIFLTAAQCSGSFQNGVVIGGMQLDGSDGTLVTIEKEAVHPGYDALTGDNNVMLVKLAQTTNATAVFLNFDSEVPISDEALTLVGYRQEEKDSVGHTLQKVGVEIYRDDLCDVTDAQICTRAEDANSSHCAKDR